MTKDVLVSISGMHTDAIDKGDLMNEPIEVITPASYFFKNGKHYVLYDEVAEGISGVTKNQIKISDNDSVEIMKRGITNTLMVFERNKKNITRYQTPYGELMMEIHTKNIDIHEEEEEIRIRISYNLDINDEAVAECKIRMVIKPKSAGMQI